MKLSTKHRLIFIAELYFKCVNLAILIVMTYAVFTFAQGKKLILLESNPAIALIELLMVLAALIYVSVEAGRFIERKKQHGRK